MGSPIYGGRVPYYEGLLQKKFCDTFAFYTINDMLLTKKSIFFNIIIVGGVKV